MSINVATSLGSLVSIGLSFGDAASLWSVGKNFLSLPSDEAQFLQLMDLDEMEILRRKGLIDILEFNKRWSKQLNILVNGRAERIEGKYAQSIQGEVTRFGASMMCLVATLDQSASVTTVIAVMKEVLRRLFQTHDAGEALIEARVRDLIRAWRSAGVARGLTNTCKEYRRSLLERRIIQNGRFPRFEANEVADFL